MSSTQSHAGRQLLLFDLGGVLVDWAGIEPLLQLAGPGLSAEQARKYWLESPVVRSFELGQCPPLQFASEVVRELRLPCPPAEFLTRFESWDRGPLPGALDLLEELSPTFALACLSNNNELHWRKLRAVPRFLDRFQHVFVSFEIRKIKPDPDAFQYVVRELDLLPNQIIFFDDNPECVLAAARLGIQAYQSRGVNEVRQILAKLFGNIRSG